MTNTFSAIEKIASEFHRSYENQAPHFGYTTRRESAVPWEQVPEQNRALMESVVHALIAQGWIRPGPALDGHSQREVSDGGNQATDETSGPL